MPAQRCAYKNTSPFNNGKKSISDMESLNEAINPKFNKFDHR